MINPSVTKLPSLWRWVASTCIFIAIGWGAYGIANWLLSFTALAMIHRVGLSIVAGVLFYIALAFMLALWELSVLHQQLEERLARIEKLLTNRSG
jgi:hypothetical protein